MPEHQATHGAAPAAAVIDTNAALDALVFGDGGMAAARLEVEAGQLRWLACARMRDELARTLAYPALARWSPDMDVVLAQWDALTTLLPTPATDPLLRCRDGDDQVFLDLALAHQAKWLLTFDRDLLALAQRALRLGLTIQSPA